jgi:Leucine-rich repeat (LRR) protein
MAHLNLWKQQLKEVPEAIWDRLDLESLILADNGLTEISPKLARLRRLRMLDLGHNKLATLPDAFGALTCLTDFLYVHDNELEELPSSMATLTTLRYLNISENKFELFPELLCNLSGLVELRASDNQLRSLPESIGRMSMLHELHLRNNRLTWLPDSIGHLQRLRYLDLRGNPLQTLPLTIGKLPAIYKLDLRWTPSLPGCEWLRDLEARGVLVYR